MLLKVKVGSKLTVPVPANTKVTSGNPQILSVNQPGQEAELTAMKAGDAQLNLEFGGDLKGSLGVTVTPS